MKNVSERKAALIAGASIVLMAMLAAFAYGFVLQSLIVPGDATLTYRQIKDSSIIFRAGVTGFFVILLLDVIAAWALHIFFQRARRHFSLLVAWLRLLYAAILGIAVSHLLAVVHLAENNYFATVYTPDQLHAGLMLHLAGFNDTWSLGLIIFGCHLLGLGYLAWKSGFIPKVWGILLIIAGMCYIISHFPNLVFGGYKNYKAMIEGIISIPMIIGELGFGIWLLWKGGKTKTRV